MAPVFDFLYRFARVFHSDFRNRNFPPPPLTRLSDTPYIRSEYSFRPVFCEDIFLFSGEDGKNRLYTHGNFCVTESSESLREKDRFFCFPKYDFARSRIRRTEILCCRSALILAFISCTNTFCSDFRPSDKAVFRPVFHLLKNQNPTYDKTLPTTDRQPIYDLFLCDCFRAEGSCRNLYRL